MSGRLARIWRFAPSAVIGLVAVSLLTVTGVSGVSSVSSAAPPDSKKLLDPAAWGTDHVGQGLPEYMESGECLFCHRLGAGATWARNKHNRTIRDAEADEPAVIALRADTTAKPFADEIQLLLGDTRAQRFLKRSSAYGKLDLLSTSAALRPGRRPRIDSARKPHWDEQKFALSCAGCHTTAVNPQTHAFTAISLDCFACHGDSPAEHANDSKLMTLAKVRKDSPQIVTSICASCHVRNGKSKSTGLPYATNFVAGDNLFKDFQVDWKSADDPKLNPADRHVLDNVRDVVLYGQESITCLSCHQVHSGSTKPHRDLPVTQYCQHCHEAGEPIKGHKTYEVHSDRCEY